MHVFVCPIPGVIRTALGPGDMDREQREHYQVVIEAKDMAGQRGGLTGTTVVNISLTDVNDNPPRFTQRKIKMAERSRQPPSPPAAACDMIKRSQSHKVFNSKS